MSCGVAVLGVVCAGAALRGQSFCWLSFMTAHIASSAHLLPAPAPQKSTNASKTASVVPLPPALTERVAVPPDELVLEEFEADNNSNGNSGLSRATVVHAALLCVK